MFTFEGPTHLLLLSQIQSNPHTFPHTFEAAEAQTPHSTLTLSWLLRYLHSLSMTSFHQNFPFYDVISQKLALLWCHITEPCLVMMSYHRNLPCYDVISQKLALLWRHITETCRWYPRYLSRALRKRNFLIETIDGSIDGTTRAMQQ
jgi:hypothetical protein